MRFLAAYIMQGRMQAIVAASVLAMLSLMLPPVSLLSAAAMALVALRNGFRESGLVLAGSAIAVALLGGLLFGNSIFTILYALGFWIPIWLIAVLLRETGKIVTTLEVTLVLAVGVVAAVYLFEGDPATLWQQRLQVVLTPILQNAPADFDAGQFELGLKAASVYMTGIVAVGSMASLVLALFLARWWQSTLYNPGGFRKEFLSLRPHAVFSGISLVLIVLATATGGHLAEALRNIGILVFFFYLVVGVSVVHCVISVMKQRFFLLPLMYALMIFVPHTMLPVAIVGLTDSWANWRRRFIVSGAV